MNYITFKLLLSVLAVTETGAVSTSVLTMDVPDGPQCAKLADTFSQNTIVNLSGHRIAIKITTSCVPLTVAGGPLPPPLAGFLHGLQGMQR